MAERSWLHILAVRRCAGLRRLAGGLLEIRPMSRRYQHPIVARTSAHWAPMGVRRKRACDRRKGVPPVIPGLSGTGRQAASSTARNGRDRQKTAKSGQNDRRRRNSTALEPF